jgi:hypothetical protein
MAAKSLNLLIRIWHLIALNCFSPGTFVLGWLLGAYLLGGYGPDGQGVNGFSNAMIATLKSWAVGIPVSIVEVQYVA